MPLSPGAKLGPYEIFALIGSGGMGEVYKARDTRLGRDVAIKVSKETFTDRFEREARSIAALNHPNICHLYDVGPNYLVMELIEGTPLKGPLPLNRTIEYAGEILDALDAAHQKDVIHRDLKPANILVTKQGIKLLDFGLAKQAVRLSEEDATKALTDQGQILGTLQYMSPEQLQGKEADSRSDLFSFGCVLYEMLTGKRAFDGSSAASVIAAIVEREPAPMSATTPVDRILKRCLAKDPDKRFQTARDLKAALNWALEQPAVVPDQRWSSLPWLIATAMLTLALIAVGVFFWRATRPADASLMRFNLDLGPDALAGPRITAAISPDGTRLVYTARGAGGKPQIATRTLDQPQPMLLAGTEDATDPFFSPDSQWIGFFTGGLMKKISVQGGATVTICDTRGSGTQRGASWGEDGQIVFTPASGSVGLMRVPDSGGAPQFITKPADGEISHRSPQVLPGEKAVLFTSTATVRDYDDGVIEALTLKTGKWKVVQRGGYFGRYVSNGNGREGQLLYIHQGTLFGVPFDLDRLEAKGTPASLLEDVDASTFYGSGQFDFSQNGIFIYANGRGAMSGWPIVWLDSSAKTQPLVAAAPNDHPVLSPDGKRLITVVRGDVQIYDTEQDRTTRLTFDHRSARAIWSPSSKYVVFGSAKGSSGSVLEWIRADGAGEPQTLMEAKNPIAPWSFTPDGKRLAFQEVAERSSPRIWVLPLELTDPEHPKPGKAEPLFETYGAGPSFSPDGRWIAYVGRESGPSEVYVRPFPGPGGKWQVSNGGGVSPVWSHTGQELFFENRDGHIMVAGYTTKGESFEAGKPHVWSNAQLLPFGFGERQFDLAPDGKRFAAAVRAESTAELNAPVHITVILNFFDLLRRRAPVTK